ncbi:MAG: branched-chain amino acid transport system II carrier protein [Eggerthella lenta]
MLLGVLLRAFPRIRFRRGRRFAAFSCAVSLVGLDAILAFSAPWALYPPAIVLVVRVSRTGAATAAAHACAVLATAAFSVAWNARRVRRARGYPRCASTRRRLGWLWSPSRARRRARYVAR